MSSIQLPLSLQWASIAFPLKLPFDVREVEMAKRMVRRSFDANDQSDHGSGPLHELGACAGAG